MSDISEKKFFLENIWGMIIALIVGLIGVIFSHFVPGLQLLSYILQVVMVVGITTMLTSNANRYQRKTIESSTDVALRKIEIKYKGISCDSPNFFEILQFNDGGSFYNVAHNIFFNILIKSYYKNGKNRKYCITIDTYYEIIKTYLSIGYKLKTINALLLPFWYAPKEQNKALTDYTKFCKEKAEFFERVTYYQDYDKGDWKNNTVKMIYEDLLYSDKSDDVAVRWLITLIAKISTLKSTFGREIEEILGIDEIKESINYFQLNKTGFNDAIKDNIEKVAAFLDKQDGGTTISRKMTSIINDLFYNDMKGKNKFVAKSDIVAMFDKEVINFEDVTAVCYYYKEDVTDDQFVVFLNGSNTGPSVEIEIVTDEDRITKIQQILTVLLRSPTA